MDVDNADHQPSQNPKDNLTVRPPKQEDLVALCRRLNEEGARYMVIGGFAIMAAGYPRPTMDIDLLVAGDLENEARIYRALASLPDNAVGELHPGELEKFTVIRVADEFVVDLMKSAGGIEYAEAAQRVVVCEVQGVPIPFASPQLLWRMKAVTHREKDIPDLLFLRQWFLERGEPLPSA
jgi:hypothetical protein